MLQAPDSIGRVYAALSIGIPPFEISIEATITLDQVDLSAVGSTKSLAIEGPGTWVRAF